MTTVHMIEAQRNWLLLRAPSVVLEAPAAGAADDERQLEAAAIVRRQRVAALLEACAIPHSSDDFAPLSPRRHDAASMPSCSVTTGQPPQLRYQWRRDGVDLPGADQDYLVLPADSASDDGSGYSVLIGNDAGARSVACKPAVVVTLDATGEPPWRWGDLAAQLRGRPDLLATLFTAFRGRCTKG